MTNPSAWIPFDASAWLTAGAFLVLAAFTLARGVTSSFPRLPRIATALLAIAIVVGGIGVAFGVSALDRAVLVDGDVTLRISPFAEAEASGSLPEGTVVRVERAWRDHVHVRTEDGRSGWAAAAQVTKILP